MTTRGRSDFIGQSPDRKLRPACTSGGTKLSERRVHGVFIGDPTALACCERTYVDHPRYHPQIRTLFAEKRCRPTELPRQLDATSVALVSGLPQTANVACFITGKCRPHYDSCTSSHVCLCSNVAYMWWGQRQEHGKRDTTVGIGGLRGEGRAKIRGYR